MIDIMVDLETLGRRPGCKILSIGAVVFGDAGLGSEFYCEAKIEGQGLLVAEVETLEWWSHQSPEARDRLFGDQEVKLHLSQVLKNFSRWMQDVAGAETSAGLPVRLWGNGADFDNAILQVAYEAVTPQQPPWEFYNNRCYRTLKGLVPTIKMARQGTHHNALDDAKSQAEHAIRLLRFLGNLSDGRA